MGRMRLNKKERVQLAGKGNRLAQYVWGAKKRADKVFKTHKHLA